MRELSSKTDILTKWSLKLSSERRCWTVTGWLSLLNVLSALSRAGDEHSHYDLINWNCTVNGSMIVLHLLHLKRGVGYFNWSDFNGSADKGTENRPASATLPTVSWWLCTLMSDDLKSQTLTWKSNFDSESFIQSREGQAPLECYHYNPRICPGLCSVLSGETGQVQTVTGPSAVCSADAALC